MVMSQSIRFGLSHFYKVFPKTDKCVIKTINVNVYLPRGQGTLQKPYKKFANAVISDKTELERYRTF